MADLTSKQRAHLRGLAHALKPLAHIGKEGVTDAAVRALQQTFDTHELVKVRVLEAAPESAKDTAHALAGRAVRPVSHTPSQSCQAPNGARRREARRGCSQQSQKKL